MSKVDVSRGLIEVVSKLTERIDTLEQRLLEIEKVAYTLMRKQSESEDSIIRTSRKLNEEVETIKNKGETLNKKYYELIKDVEEIKNEIRRLVKLEEFEKVKTILEIKQ